MIRRTRLAPVSERRREGSQEYERALQEAFWRDRGQCRAAELVPEVDCAGRIDPHHVAPQSQYPELRCEVTNIICVCRRHHDWIDQHPIKARERGLRR